MSSIKRAILILWIIAAMLTFMPFIGFGVYYKNNECVRYRDALDTIDLVYANIFFTFGKHLLF